MNYKNKIYNCTFFNIKTLQTEHENLTTVLKITTKNQVHFIKLLLIITLAHLQDKRIVILHAHVLPHLHYISSHK